MASSTPLCGTCEFRHVTKTADVWCSDCDEGFCSDCDDHHHSAKMSRNHKRTPIEDYQKLPAYILEVEKFCQEHNERFILFCKHHDSPYCRSCSLEKHKECQDVGKLEEVVRNVKTSHAFQETEQILIELNENIRKIKKDRDVNLESLENSKTKIKKQIQEFRIKLNDHLDKLQKETIQELNRAAETERKVIQQIIDGLHIKERETTEMKENLSKIKQYASDLQAYLAMQRIQNDANKIESGVESLVHSGHLQQKVLSMEINVSMIDFLSSVKTFGKILVETKDCKVVLTKKNIQQAQLLMTPNKRTINDITVQLQQKLNVNINYITVCCRLPDGRLVFTSDTSKCIVFINIDGTNRTTLNLPFLTFDVTYVKYNDSLAVTSGDSGNTCITLIDIKNPKVKDTITLSSECYGIAEKNNILYFCDRTSIKSLNLKNNSINKFKDINPVVDSYIDIFENNLYHTNMNTNTVTCYDLNSSYVKWEFIDKRIVNSPLGISVDSQGNVYVVGNRTHNVVVISTDGQKCRELLSNKDKLSQPWSIHYEKSTNNLIVTNGSRTAFVYTIT